MYRTSPPTLCVITFDEKGNQTDRVLTVPLPADLLAIPTKEWYKHKQRMKQHLIDAVGSDLDLRTATASPTFRVSKMIVAGGAEG